MGKTSTIRDTMSPIVMLLLSKLLEYLAENADEMVAAIKKQFLTDKKDPEISSAIQDLGYEPTEKNLAKLHDVLQEKGQDTGKLAQIIINKAMV